MFMGSRTLKEVCNFLTVMRINMTNHVLNVFVVDFRGAVMSSPDEKVAASISEEPEDAGNDAKKPEVNSATTYMSMRVLYFSFR